jgi:RNA polymerase sigma factor (sigma-70 family)
MLTPLGPTDGELLQRFIQWQDHRAFDVLLHRHGAMVRGVCWRVLRNSADADDAFQATFLVLIARAASIHSRDALGPWLHSVAHRTALKARTANVRRRHEERQAAEQARARRPHDSQPSLAGEVDRELALLPARYRLVLVHCDLEGRSIQETGKLLGCPLGTVASRLARGRQLLARRLGRLGVSVPAGLLLAPCWPTLALMDATVDAALVFNAGAAGPLALLPARILTLTREVIWSMTMQRCKTIAAVLLSLVVLCAGGALMVRAALAASTNQAAKGDAQSAVPAAQDRLWADLASTVESTSSRALLALAATPKQTLSLFRERLRPVKVDAKRTATLIAQLDSESFQQRETAHSELEYLGKYVKADLQKAADGKGTVELKRRAKRLLEQITEENPARPAAPQFPNGGAVSVSNNNGVMEITINGKKLDLTPRVQVKRGPPPSWLRAVRAAAVLEHIGTAEAARMLEALAGGEKEALPTKAAIEALKRLKK